MLAPGHARAHVAEREPQHLVVAQRRCQLRRQRVDRGRRRQLRVLGDAARAQEAETALALADAEHARPEDDEVAVGDPA